MSLWLSGSEAEAFFGSGDAEASFSKNLGSEASTEASAIYIYICLYTQNKHLKYQISCRRHENMHIFA